MKLNIRLTQDGTQIYKMKGNIKNCLFMHKIMSDLLKMSFKFQLNRLVWENPESSWFSSRRQYQQHKKHSLRRGKNLYYFFISCTLKTLKWVLSPSVAPRFLSWVAVADTHFSLFQCRFSLTGIVAEPTLFLLLRFTDIV